MFWGFRGALLLVPGTFDILCLAGNCRPCKRVPDSFVRYVLAPDRSRATHGEFTSETIFTSAASFTEYDLQISSLALGPLLDKTSRIFAHASEESMSGFSMLDTLNDDSELVVELTYLS